jgi:hypothetical protein
VATTLTQKLQLKTGQRLRLLNAPAGLAEQIAADGVLLATNAAAADDATLLFVANMDEAQRLAPPAVQAAAPDTLLWIAYPKGGSPLASDINRDRVWPVIEPTGWRPVRQIAIDETWSALRFRPADQVRGRKKDNDINLEIR